MDIQKVQRQVGDFAEENNLEGTVEFRIMDLVSEVGEVVKDATKSADYGNKTEKLEVKEGEIGDVFFSLFMVCNNLGINAEEALETALEKYTDRIHEKGDPGSK